MSGCEAKDLVVRYTGTFGRDGPKENRKPSATSDTKLI
jgi:hypothetical protein